MHAGSLNGVFGEMGTCSCIGRDVPGKGLRKVWVDGMNVRNCKMCGRIFNYVGGPIWCQRCKEKMEEKFQEVKEFIRNNPGVDINVVSQECDVSTAQIQQWLRDERLEVTENSAIFLTCEKCGANIRSGRFCEKCKYDMTMGFQHVIDKNKPTPPAKHKDPKDNPKMRFL